MRKIWFDEAWDDYLYWQTQDRKTLKRIRDKKRRNSTVCVRISPFLLMSS